MTDNNSIYKTLEKMRELKGKLNEEEAPVQDNGDTLDAIPYTANDDMLAKMTNEAKTIFGADFTKSKTPLLYYPKDGDVTLTGEVKNLNCKFQWKLLGNSESGMIIWVESLPITDNVVTILNKMNGAGKNWKSEYGSGDLKPVSARDDDNSTQQLSESIVPGDDLPSEPKRFQNGDDLD